MSKDPRLYILAFLLSFVAAGQLFLGFFQRWDSFFASVFTAVALEFVLVGLLKKKWAFPLSALITGIGISLLLSSYAVWPYVLTAVLAVTIKQFVRLRGAHIFNPNNVAMVIMLIALPAYAVSTPKQWTNGIEVMSLIMILGLFAAYKAKRLDSVLAFIGGFTFFAAIRVGFFGEPALYAFGPMMGASFQLFSFFMITDPKTTPPTRKARILFAFLIAFTDAWLRVNQITNSQFYASFLVTLLLGVPYRLLAKKAGETGIPV
ncbi:RnfABCDGE type electron transport complex subunit D [Paenibacillus chitinolyticus]|uniref:RnfABCDGE type electron transport complex subunit D n=1 Tax=Paenibacillus chitinolyticus TaxID=79263 RepID=UPI00366AB5BD